MKQYTDTELEELLEQNNQLKRTIDLVEENKSNAVEGFRKHNERLAKEIESLENYIKHNKKDLSEVDKLIQQLNELEKELSDKEEEHERQLKSLKLKTSVLESLGYTEKDLEVFSKIRWLGYEEGYDDARGGW